MKNRFSFAILLSLFLMLLHTSLHAGSCSRYMKHANSFVFLGNLPFSSVHFISPIDEDGLKSKIGFCHQLFFSKSTHEISKKFGYSSYVPLQTHIVSTMDVGHDLIQIQRKQFHLLLFFVGFMLLFLVILVRMYHLNARKNKNMERQQHVINEVNQELYCLIKEKEILLKEIHHRVKNNLQLVMSMLNLQSMGQTSLQDFLDHIQTRIQSMSIIHDNLYREHNLSKINFKDYVEKLFFHTKKVFHKPHQDISLELVGEDVVFDVQTAIPLGLILNEIMCNTFKHAFQDRQKGTIKVTWQVQADAQLEYILLEDDGVGIAKDHQKNQSSLGIPLIEMLCKQLHGTVRQTSDRGTKYEIVL
jgi:two-component sensor histidine kinase